MECLQPIREFERTSTSCSYRHITSREHLPHRAAVMGVVKTTSLSTYCRRTSVDRLTDLRPPEKLGIPPTDHVVLYSTICALVDRGAASPNGVMYKCLPRLLQSLPCGRPPSFARTHAQAGACRTIRSRRSLGTIAANLLSMKHLEDASSALPSRPDPVMSLGRNQGVLLTLPDHSMYRKRHPRMAIVAQTRSAILA